MADCISDKKSQFPGKLQRSTKPLTNETDENKVEGLNNRVLVYPRAVLTISVEIPRSKSMFVVVKTRVIGHILELGRTETLICEDSQERITFRQKVAITYLTGIDDDQQILFELMDGDSLSTSTFGYLFATVVAPVADVFKPYHPFPIMQGSDCLGYVHVDSILDVASEVLDVRKFDKYEKYQTGFFEHRLPTDKEVREEYERFEVPTGQYVLEIDTKDVCKIPKDLINEGETFVQVCLSLNVTFAEEDDKEAPTEYHENGQRIIKKIKKPVFLPVYSSNLHRIWESIPNYTEPFKMSVFVLKFNHHELTLKENIMDIITAAADRQLDEKFPNELKLVVEVFVGGTESANSPAIRVGYSAYSVWKLLMGTQHPTKVEKGFLEQDGEWSKPQKRYFVQTHDFFDTSETKQPSTEKHNEHDSSTGRKSEHEGRDDEFIKSTKNGGGLFGNMFAKKSQSEKTDVSGGGTDGGATGGATGTDVFGRRYSRSKEVGGDGDEEAKGQKPSKGGFFGLFKRSSAAGIECGKDEGNGNKGGGVRGKDLMSSRRGSERGSEKGESKRSSVRGSTTPLGSLKISGPGKIAGKESEKQGKSLRVGSETEKKTKNGILALGERFFKKGGGKGEMSKEMKAMKKEFDEICSYEDKFDAREKKAEELNKTIEALNREQSKSEKDRTKKAFAAYVDEGEKKRKGVDYQGQCVLRMKMAFNSVEAHPGDPAYEERIREKFEEYKKVFIGRMRHAFFSACTSQSANTKDGTYLLEFTRRGCSIAPMVVTDLHVPCLQSLLFGLKEEKARDNDKPLFPGSRVLDALQDLYKATSVYAKHGHFQIFAGGGVKPPSPEHAAIGWGRTTAFPLVQEIVLYADRPKFQKAIEHSKKVIGEKKVRDKFIADKEKEIEELLKTEKEAEEEVWKVEKEKLLKHRPHRMRADIREYDPDSMLATCMGFDEGSPYYWGGMDYSGRSFDGWQEIRKGFVDSCTIYRPHITKDDQVLGAAAAEKEQQKKKGGRSNKGWSQSSGSVRDVGQSDFDDGASSQYGGGRSKHKTLSADDSKVKKLSDRINACRSGIELGVNTDEFGEKFWDKIPSDFIVRKKSQFHFNSDVDAIESLLQRECSPASVDEPQINFVVWILGKPPSHNDIGKIDGMFRRQAASRGRVALLVVLASEFRFDVDTNKDDVIEKTMADPFRELIRKYKQIVHEYAEDDDSGVKTAASVRFKVGPPKGSVRGGAGNLPGDAGKKRNIFGDDDPEVMPSSPRLKLFHWLTWAEVMAKSFVEEDHAKGLREKKKAVKELARSERLAAAAGSETQKNKKGFLRGPFGGRKKKGGGGAKKEEEAKGSASTKRLKALAPIIRMERGSGAGGGLEGDDDSDDEEPQVDSNYPNFKTIRHILIQHAGLEKMAADRIVNSHFCEVKRSKDPFAVVKGKKKKKNALAKAAGAVKANVSRNVGNMKANVKERVNKVKAGVSEKVRAVKNKEGVHLGSASVKLGGEEGGDNGGLIVQQEMLRKKGFTITPDQQLRISEEILIERNLMKKLKSKSFKHFDELVGMKDRYDHEKAVVYRSEIRKFLVNILMDVSRLRYGDPPPPLILPKSERSRTGQVKSTSYWFSSSSISEASVTGAAAAGGGGAQAASFGDFWLQTQSWFSAVDLDPLHLFSSGVSAAGDNDNGTAMDDEDDSRLWQVEDEDEDEDSDDDDSDEDGEEEEEEEEEDEEEEEEEEEETEEEEEEEEEETEEDEEEDDEEEEEDDEEEEDEEEEDEEEEEEEEDEDDEDDGNDHRWRGRN